MLFRKRFGTLANAGDQFDGNKRQCGCAPEHSHDGEESLESRDGQVTV